MEHLLLLIQHIQCQGRNDLVFTDLAIEDIGNTGEEESEVWKMIWSRWDKTENVKILGTFFRDILPQNHGVNI